jgi:predicted ATPase
MKKTAFIVLTGGPGAGKTAVLEMIRKIYGPSLTLLPEAASLLFNGGFPRINSVKASRAAQRAIYHVQNESQNVVVSASKSKFAICDRGTLDGLAYWRGQKKDFFKELNTDLTSEYKKYKAVIHLQSPGLDKGYNHQNPVRTETVREAMQIDSQIQKVWEGHPQYFRVESTINFIEKANIATQIISSIIQE